jgi:L-arabinose isomerase
LRREHLDDFAALAGIELVSIGDGTTVSDIRKELRWNQAYHQLARGL